MVGQLTEIEVLRLLTWPALILCIAATVVMGILYIGANGSRGLIRTQLYGCILVTIWAVFSVILTYNITQVNSNGIAEVGVWYVRIYPSLKALTIIRLGWQYWSRR